MLIRSQHQNSQVEFGGLNQGYNSSSQGDNNADELVSRLNAKITNMKINEDKLVQ